MKYQILNRYDSRVQFEMECGSMKECVEAAITQYADLRSANLRSADLQSADLRSADLRYANLRYANLRYANLQSADLRYADLRYADLGEKIGKLKSGGYFTCGPQGSRNDMLMAFNSDNGMFVKAGCFTGSLDEFRAAVIKTHGKTSKHGKLYLGVANLIEYKFSEVIA